MEVNRKIQDKLSDYFLGGPFFFGHGVLPTGLPGKSLVQGRGGGHTFSHTHTTGIQHEFLAGKKRV